MVHVLLLGGHGKVALYLTPLLLNRSWRVTSLVRNPDHEAEIRQLGTKRPGKLDILFSSLDDVKSDGDAQKILDTVKPDVVVWAAGAGGKGGPERTHAIDSVAARHFVSAVYASPTIRKFLLISHIGSRRLRPSWMPDAVWQRIDHVNKTTLAAYWKAKLEADEYMVARLRWREQQPELKSKPFQSICLRPGWLKDDPATGKVALGRIAGEGSVTREDVARVTDAVLARDDTHGWYDLLNGDEPIEQAVERVVKNKEDAIEGEDIEAMVQRWS